MPVPDDSRLVEEASEALFAILTRLDKDNNIPRKKLMNRLINIGLREFFEIIEMEDGSRKLAIEDRGFPFKFVEQLDEAILALAHYFMRFRDEGGSLNVYAVNRLSKGEDKTLSYWQSEKARLYIELQNLILLLNGVRDSFWRPRRQAEVRRILTFRNTDDIAFLTQSAINVVSEQLAAGVRVGFLFLNQLVGIPAIDLLSNTLIIDFKPQKQSQHILNFYALYRLIDESGTHVLPYQDHCKTRWYRSDREALSCDSRLSEIMRLFDVKEWKPLDEKTKHGVCEFERTGNEFFNKATLTLYKAFQASSVRKSYGGIAQDSDEAFISRLNETVITNDLIRLERAMQGFANSKRISAVDATSVKESLKIHESTPIYRHWLRNTLNRVLQSDENALERLYILRDTSRDAGVEFQAFKRQMQYYFDYLHFNISEITRLVHAHDPDEFKKNTISLNDQSWFIDKWKSLQARFRIYVTTTSVIEKFAARTMNSETHPKMLGDILSETVPAFSDLHVLVSRLDYLTTENMIYNFKNELADPSELKFEAYLYRTKESFDIGMERSLLFDFANQTGLSRLKAIQTRQRLKELLSSTIEYRDQYIDILSSDSDKHNDVIDRVAKLVAENREVSSSDINDLLKVRQAFEGILYEYFRPRFLHLSELIKFHSVEIKFFNDRRSLMIDDIEPFNVCESMTTLTQFITQEVELKLSQSGPPTFQVAPRAQHDNGFGLR